VQAVDYDRDGREDLLVCAHPKHGTVLFRNMRGRRFRKVTKKKGADGPCTTAAFATVNRDKRLDLVRLSGKKLVVKTQRRKGRRFGARPHYSRKVKRGRDLALGNINGDGRPDIYVLRQSRYVDSRGDQQAPDAFDLMLINKRGGKRFTRRPIPQTRLGIGDSVDTIDYDRNGLDDFIVLNGYRKATGPVRLVAFFRAGS
jgi:hypothetical protein